MLVVRPVSFAALVVGAAISLVATPFALASGTTSPVYEKLVSRALHVCDLQTPG